MRKPAWVLCQYCTNSSSQCSAVGKYLARCQLYYIIVLECRWFEYYRSSWLVAIISYGKLAVHDMGLQTVGMHGMGLCSMDVRSVSVLCAGSGSGAI